MATRNTMIEAQELKERIEARHPDAKIVIIHVANATRRVGRVVAEEKGFEIVEDNGGIMVTVNETRFDVLEVRTCRDCGDEYHTAAIGEADAEMCAECENAFKSTFEQELEKRCEAEAERQRELDWRNYFEEPRR